MIRHLRSVAAIAAIACVLAAGPAAAQQPTDTDLKDARAAAETFLAGCREKNVDKIMSVLADDYASAFTGQKKDNFRKESTACLESSYESVSPTLEAVEPAPGFIKVRYSSEIKMKPSAGGGAQTIHRVLFLQRRGSDMRVVSAAQQLTSGTVEAGRYRSATGQFSLPIPEGWTPLGSPSELATLVPDAVMALAPDLKSFVLLGFVQLPMNLGSDAAAKMCLNADEGMTKRMAAKYTATEPEPVTLGGLKGLRVTSEFSVQDQTRKRIRAYVAKDKLVYFFICDADPPSAFDALKPTFETVMNGFALHEGKGGVPVAEQIASKLSQGSVTGNVYQNAEYNCQIAAPKGWEINASPNPLHLVEMQYKQGKSFARLVAAKGLSADTTVRKAFDERLKSVKSIVKDFKEESQTETKVGGQPAIQSVHSYTVEGFGKIKVKEATVVHNGIYYLILCQAMEGDPYEKLSADFDAIIASFGFTQ